jgi:hypothetical protein
MRIEVKEFEDRKEWYLNGVLHRDYDLPAVVYNDGTKKWYKNGKLHRDNGLPAVEESNGKNYWYYKNGKVIPDKVAWLD